MNILYNNNSVIGRLFQYFSAYFTSTTRPTRTLLTWMLIGMLVLEGLPSIRWLYRHFLSQVSPKSLNCYTGHALSPSWMTMLSSQQRPDWLWILFQTHSGMSLCF